MTASRRRTVAVLVSVVAVAALAACAAPEDAGQRDDLAAYTGQELDWGACDDMATTEIDETLFANPDLECTTVRMPIDYDDPDGERGEIGLLRLPATGDEREGSMLVNPGGPGGSGMNYVAATAGQWLENPVAERFDIVGFDPRGVGATTPRAECFTDEEYDAGGGFRVGSVYDVTSAEEAQEIADRCVEGTGGEARLTGISSTNTVRDMDLMREVLGDEKLTFLGYSYGSELGAMYTRTFPENVRAIVIDGIVSPDLSPTEFRASQFVAIQASFDKMAAVCAAAPDCVVGAEPGAATDRFHEILAPLVDTPAPTSAGRDVTIWDAYTGIIGALYNAANWPDIQASLAEYASTGRADGLLALRDTYFSRGEDGRYGLDFDSNVATRCMDWGSESPEEQTAFARDVAASSPIIDLPVFTKDFHHECEAWPEPADRGDPWLPDARGEAPPTLVLSVTGDPGTPYEGGVAMARELGGSLLTVQGEQHGSYLIGGSDCVDDIVERYLLTGETPPDGAECALP